jgi:UDP-GlcNAc:undecaprenyl-phosphate GlcNAc-1-phosphate transferase
MLKHLPFFVNALLISFVLTDVMKTHAARLGWIDKPTARKQHIGNIPVVGGLAMFAALIVTGTMPGSPVNLPLSMIAAVLLIVVIGAIDDRWSIGPHWKLVVQALTAAIMVFWGGETFTETGLWFGLHIGPVPALDITITILFVVGVINAINMMDGADGLAGCVVLPSLGWLVVAAIQFGAMTDAIILISVICVVVGFLIHNMRHPWQKRATAFMGDAGSMMLGLLIAWNIVALPQRQTNYLAPTHALWFVALPMIDMACVMARRALQRRSPFHPDREHMHHLIQRAGYSVEETVLFMTLASLALGAVGMAAWYLVVGERFMCLGLAIVVVVHFIVMTLSWRTVGTSIVTQSDSEIDMVDNRMNRMQS